MSSIRTCRKVLTLASRKYCRRNISISHYQKYNNYHYPGLPWTIRYFSAPIPDEAAVSSCSSDNNNPSTSQETSQNTATAKPEITKPLKDVRKQLWEFYVSTGKGANALFEAIDLREEGRIHPSELKAFLEEVWSSGDHPSTVMPYAWNILELRTQQNQTYTTKTFKQWLIAATKMSADQKNQRTLAYFQQSQNSPQPSKETVYSWNSDSMSQSLRRMQYAVRGEVVMRADQLAAQGKEILYTNIGNPHQVGQAPITYYRQVLALCDLPAEVGVDHPNASEMFPPDALERARELRDIIGPSGTGAYTHSQGLLGIRQHVADFIKNRDGGYPSYPGNIFLTNGASAAIAMVLQGLIGDTSDSVMIPIPQYPIYSALIAKMGGRQVGYELDERLNWTVTRHELESRLIKAEKEGLAVKAMAMINPGNPSGNIMTHCDIQTVVEFCAAHGIVLLADEVYQTNVYAPHAKFVSAKQVAYDIGLEEELQLVSFHSTSKGLIGECGRRGGYMELHNIDPYVQSQMYKLASSELCSGLQGQIMMSLMVRGPEPGDESYELHQKETQSIFDGLKERSQKLVEGLNEIDGISCAPAHGAMYAFPRLENLPESVFDKARELGTTPDNLYALSLLEDTGICVVPASGFGQSAGRVGFRTTFLHPDTITCIDKFKSHHELFMDKYTKLQQKKEEAKLNAAAYMEEEDNNDDETTKKSSSSGGKDKTEKEEEEEEDLE